MDVRKGKRGGQPDGQGKLRGRKADTQEVQLSKTISWLLRHGAKSEGLYMRPDGCVRVTDLVSSLL
jgi:2'-phosphotransferase